MVRHAPVPAERPQHPACMRATAQQLCWEVEAYRKELFPNQASTLRAVSALWRSTPTVHDRCLSDGAGHVMLERAVMHEAANRRHLELEATLREPQKKAATRGMPMMATAPVADL